MDSQGHDIQSPGAGRTVEGLAGRRILLGITGSIAAYKAAVLCRLLKCAGAEVRVVMTPLAKQFITPLTMATLSKNPILVEFFDPENGAWNSHVSLGEWADCYLIAPATANTLAKMACGIADTTVTLAAKAHLRNCRPILLAPSTNDGLAASARNLGQLMARKYIYLVPFRQDDPEEKPASLVADFSLVADAAQAALEGRQLQPVLLGPAAP